MTSRMSVTGRGHRSSATGLSNSIINVGNYGHHNPPLGNVTSTLSTPELEDRLLRMADDREALLRRNNDLEDKLKKVGTRYLRLLKGESKLLAAAQELASDTTAGGLLGSTTSIGGHLATHERDDLATHVSKVEKENVDLRRLVQILRVENQRFNSSTTNFHRRNQNYTHIPPRIDTGLATAAMSRMSAASNSRFNTLHDGAGNPSSVLLFEKVTSRRDDHNSSPQQFHENHTSDAQQQQTAAAAEEAENRQLQQQQQDLLLLSQYTQLIQRLDEKCGALQSALAERETLMEQLISRLRTEQEQHVGSAEKAFENNVKLIRARRELEQVSSELRSVKQRTHDESVSTSSMKSLVSTLEHDNQHLTSQLNAERELTKQLRTQAHDEAFQRVDAQQLEKRNAFLEKECTLLREQNEALLKNLLDLTAQNQQHRNVTSSTTEELYKQQLEAAKVANRLQLDEQSNEIDQLKHERSTLSERIRVAEATVETLKAENNRLNLELRAAKHSYADLESTVNNERDHHRAEIAKRTPNQAHKSSETVQTATESRRVNTSPDAPRQVSERGIQQTPSLLSMQNNIDKLQQQPVEQLLEQKQLFDEIEKLRNVVIAQSHTKTDLESEVRVKDNNYSHKLSKMHATVKRLRQRLNTNDVPNNNAQPRRGRRRKTASRQQPSTTADEESNPRAKHKSAQSDDSPSIHSSSSTLTPPQSETRHEHTHSRARRKRASNDVQSSSRHKSKHSELSQTRHQRSKSVEASTDVGASPQARLPTARSRIVELFIKSFEITVDDYFFVDRAYFLSIRFLSDSLEDSPLVRVNELDATMEFSYRAKYVLPMYESSGADMLSILNARRIEFYLFEVFKAEKSLVAQTVVGVDQLTFEHASNSDLTVASPSARAIDASMTRVGSTTSVSEVSGALVARATVGLYSDFKVPVGLLVFKLSYKPFVPDAGLESQPITVASSLALRKNRSKSQVEFSRVNPRENAPPAKKLSLPSSIAAPAKTERFQSRGPNNGVQQTRAKVVTTKSNAKTRERAIAHANDEIDSDEFTVDDDLDFETEDDDEDLNMTLSMRAPVPTPRRQTSVRTTLAQR